MICGLCREMLLRVNVQYRVNCQRRVLIKLETERFMGLTPPFFRKDLQREGSDGLFEDEMSRDLWEMYVCRMTTLEK